MIPPSVEVALQMELFTAIVLIQKNPDSLDSHCSRMLRLIENALRMHAQDYDEDKIMKTACTLMEACPVSEVEAEAFLRRMREQSTVI